MYLVMFMFKLHPCFVHCFTFHMAYLSRVIIPPPPPPRLHLTSAETLGDKMSTLD